MAKSSENKQKYKIFREYKVQSIELFKNYEQNSRTHTEEQIQEVVNSINEFGYTNPILVDENNVIIAGHCRIEGARRAGMAEIPSIIIDGLTDAQKAALVIADNKLALNAGWNYEKLASQIFFLKDNNYDISLTGFKADELTSFMPDIVPEFIGDEDDVPETPVNPITKLGDVWLLDNHRLMCGDSTVIDQVEKLMNTEKADMIYTDPPYGINLETNYKKRYGHEKGSSSSQFYGEDNGIDLKMIINNSFSIQAKDLFIFGADNYPDCLPRGGSWIVWDKSVEAVDGIASDFELCWSRERHHYSMCRKLWKGAKAREETGQEGNHRTRWGHPTQKPIELALYFFDKWGKKYINILDYFGGSGTTLMACEKTNRKCFMMEISPNYCDVIIARWEKFTGKKAILEDSNGSRC